MNLEVCDVMVGVGAEVPGSPATMREPVAKAALWGLQQQLKQCVVN